MKRLELGTAARADLRDIWLFTAQRWGRGQADRYGDALNEAIASLTAGSDVGRKAAVGDYRRVSVKSHVIYYRERHDTVRVVRVLHERMDAARHLPD